MSVLDKIFIYSQLRRRNKYEIRYGLFIKKKVNSFRVDQSCRGAYKRLTVIEKIACH